MKDQLYRLELNPISKIVEVVIYTGPSCSDTLTEGEK